MKKTLLIAVIAAVAIVAFAAPAFADKGSFVTNPGSTAGSYIAWSTALGTNGATSPHGAYATTTVKCAVCHAVHQASDAGELLLKADVANACNYCHVDNANPANYPQVYGGDPTYLTLSSNAHHTSNCGNCHSVHGAGTFTDASVASYILKSPGDSTNFAGTLAAGKTNATASGDDARALVCARSGCHSSYYVGDSQTAAMRSGLTTNTNGSFTHPMRAATVLWNGSGSGATNTGQTIAFKSSATCRSCHDAEELDAVDGDGYSFPHYTPGAARFLLQAPDAATAASGVGSSAQSSENSTTSTANVVGAETIDFKYGTAYSKTLSDGVCLKCHREGNGVSGVGLEY